MPYPEEVAPHRGFGGRARRRTPTHYASIPRTPDRRGGNNLLDAVTPRGTLLVVSHDIDQMRAHDIDDVVLRARRRAN